MATPGENVDKAEKLLERVRAVAREEGYQVEKPSIQAKSGVIKLTFLPIPEANGNG